MKSDTPLTDKVRDRAACGLADEYGEMLEHAKQLERIAEKLARSAEHSSPCYDGKKHKWMLRKEPAQGRVFPA